MAGVHTSFVASECEALAHEIAATEDVLDDAARAAYSARVVHLLERIDAVAAVDENRAEIAAVVGRALMRESARAVTAERELTLLHAGILRIAPVQLGVGSCATACLRTWHCLADRRSASEVPPKVEAALASELIEHKADIMARTSVAVDAAQTLQHSEHAARGGLWMDVSSANPDTLCQDTAQRRY
jgi:hypothetical protein